MNLLHILNNSDHYIIYSLHRILMCSLCINLLEQTSMADNIYLQLDKDLDLNIQVDKHLKHRKKHMMNQAMQHKVYMFNWIHLRKCQAGILLCIYSQVLHKPNIWYWQVISMFIKYNFHFKQFVMEYKSMNMIRRCKWHKNLHMLKNS